MSPSPLIVLILVLCFGLTTCVDLYGPPGTESKSDSDQFNSEFTNDPIVIYTGYHNPTAYESQSYDFWYENRPQPHYHGYEPKSHQRHQHFPAYNDNYNFRNFITDPPTTNDPKSEPVGDRETPLVDEPDGSRETTAYNKQQGYDIETTYSPIPSSTVKEKLVEDVETLPPKSESEPTDTQLSSTISASDSSPPGADSTSNNDSDSKTEFYKSPPGVQPELFEGKKLATPQEQYVPADPTPTPDVGDFFAKEEHPAQPQPQRPEIIRPTLTKVSTSDPKLASETSSGPRSCCPCCHETRPSFPPRGPNPDNVDNGCGGVVPSSGGCKGSCGGNVICGPPPIITTPPQCCPTAPLPCCPRLPTCCTPQLPCCPKIQIPCCPPIQVCCHPLNFGGCGGGCRSRTVARVRSKRFGCLPCLGRKKRDAFTDVEEPHIRQKRLNCIPCLARQKRQNPSNCQRCNPLISHFVSRVKRSFSCSACGTHKERIKRQTAIADYYRGNVAGAYRNCQVCNTLPLPHVMKKRSISLAQNDFLARIKRGFDTGYDPLFKCDAGCCDFTKCIRSKPLRQTFKIPEDSDFVDKNSDYDLPDLLSEENSGNSFQRKSKIKS